LPNPDGEFKIKERLIKAEKEKVWMSKRHKKGLESFVLNTNTLIRVNDKGEYYLPMCNYYPHIGVIIDEQTCFNRRCPHYGTYPLKHQKINYKIYKRKSVKPDSHSPFSDISDDSTEKNTCEVVGMENLN